MKIDLPDFFFCITRKHFPRLKNELPFLFNELSDINILCEQQLTIEIKIMIGQENTKHFSGLHSFADFHQTELNF
jgi:hypothetical protein